MTLPGSPPDRSTQLAFDLPYEEARGLSDFVPGKANRNALEFVLAWPRWPHPATFLCGPAGSGKSHLARIWAERSGAETVTAQKADLVCPRPGQPLRLVIEDCGLGDSDERALFRLFNQCLESEGAVLCTANVLPANLDLNLPDLASRLRAATPIEIESPDDDLIEAVLIKLFADRQIDINPDVAAFAIMRMERSFDAARKLVACVDRLSLAEGRRVTKQLVALALQQISVPNVT